MSKYMEYPAKTLDNTDKDNIDNNSNLQNLRTKSPVYSLKDVPFLNSVELCPSFRRTALGGRAQSKRNKPQELSTNLLFIRPLKERGTGEMNNLCCCQVTSFKNRF